MRFCRSLLEFPWMICVWFNKLSLPCSYCPWWTFACVRIECLVEPPGPWLETRVSSRWELFWGNSMEWPRSLLWTGRLWWIPWVCPVLELFRWWPALFLRFYWWPLLDECCLLWVYSTFYAHIYCVTLSIQRVYLAKLRDGDGFHACLAFSFNLLIIRLLLFGQRRLILVVILNLVAGWKLTSLFVAWIASSFEKLVVVSLVKLLLMCCDIHFLSNLLLVNDSFRNWTL